MNRHQINSWEFDMWLDELPTDIREEKPKEFLYDLWVGGYSSWEVAGILG